MIRRTLPIVIALAIAACGQGIDLADPESGEQGSTPPGTDQSPLTTPVTVTTVTAGEPPMQGETGSDDTTATTTADQAEPAEEEEPMTDWDVPGALMDQVLRDASTRTGVAVAGLVVLRAEAVTWSDGSLGCPEPGMAYTQVLTDGYWIEIDADGMVLDYRATVGGQFRLCEQASTTDGDATLVVPDPPDKGEPIPIPPPGDPGV